MSGLLTAATFEPQVGTAFVIELSGDEVLTVLESVVRQPTRSHGDRTEPFSLMFIGPAGAPLVQATYTLRHADLGTVEIFLVPIGPNGHGRQQYEAVFN